MELIAIGDLHLTAPAGRDGKDVRGGLSSLIPDHDKFVADLVIDQCLSYATKKGVKHVVLLGDVGDGTRLSYQAHHQLMRILAQPFKFHIILGNHDLESPNAEFGHSLELLRYGAKNVTVYEDLTDLDIEGAPVRMLPWPHSKFSKNRLNFSHLDIQGCAHDSGRPIDDGPASNATIINGHLHTNQTVRNTYVPGSPYQTSFGIKEGQFFAHARFGADGWDVGYVPLRPKYVLRTVELHSAADVVPVKRGELVRAIVHPSFKADDRALLQQYARLRFVSDANEAAHAISVDEGEDGSAIEFDLNHFFEVWAGQSSPDMAQQIIDKRKELFS